MQLAKAYEPKEYEADIYALWEKNDAFAPMARGSRHTYTIVIPPPNANGDLHLGHGLTLGLEDIAIRYHRMLGEKTLFLPGADHAGFETQVVYEKKLAEQGKSRFDFSRDELYEQIYDFVAQNKNNYESQFRKIGASLDWNRYVYTLDEKIVNRAYATFQKLWDEKLIYRGERLINFCTFHGTGFADIEVAYQEIKGKLWTIKYPLSDGSGEIVVATTRPETMLGDVAVAVHPDDKRYAKVIGKTVKLPLTNREIPVIADTYVDKDFGTGAVKITPAHDPNDFEIAQRHDLPMISVIGFEGTMTHHAPEKYRNLLVKDARASVVDDLKNQKMIVQETEHIHNVGHCYKCGTVIEPLLREQWFVDMQPLCKPAIKALQDGKITFYPAGKKDQLIKYLEGLRDWNISRQIAWGIPIPAFQSLNDPEHWVFDERVEEELIEIDGVTYRRDPDVFDTWFSSGSWPYATLDYPDGADFHDFYPLSVMETGADILFPWVSRMIMMGLYITGKVPFDSVYLHGLILDPEGAKMSKSKGNVVDPMSKIDQYGSDAFRMGIIAGQTAGNNQSYDEARLVAARNFCNKLWNVARFAEGTGKLQLGIEPEPKTVADHWVIGQLNDGIKKISSHLDNYRFSEAYEVLYHLIWDDVADWYIEACKADPDEHMLGYVLESSLKLAHPFAPFVTETIWQTLHPNTDNLLITGPWAKPAKHDKKQAAEFEMIKNIVSETRQIKTLLNLKGGGLYFTKSEFLNKHKDLIAALARVDDIKQVYEGKGLHLTGTSEDVWLDVDDETAQAFRDRLKTRRNEVKNLLKTIESRLANKSYAEKAPKELVKQSKNQQSELKTELEAIEKQLKSLGDLFV